RSAAASPAPAPIRRTVSPARSGSRSVTSTRAPSAAKPSAIPRPIPLPAPVTTATFSRIRTAQTSPKILAGAELSAGPTSTTAPDHQPHLREVDRRAAQEDLD